MVSTPIRLRIRKWPERGDGSSPGSVRLVTLRGTTTRTINKAIHRHIPMAVLRRQVLRTRHPRRILSTRSIKRTLSTRTDRRVG